MASFRVWVISLRLKYRY